MTHSMYYENVAWYEISSSNLRCNALSNDSYLPIHPRKGVWNQMFCRRIQKALNDVKALEEKTYDDQGVKPVR
jgi:hypothetical protein